MNEAEKIKAKTIIWLLDGGLKFNPSRHAVATEVLFSSNRRKADLVIFSSLMHTLEIKSDADSTRRLAQQLTDYYKTFDKVSIITTSNHLKKVTSLVSPATGIILFNNETFKIIRLPKTRKNLDKYSLLMFLPKNELVRAFKHPRNAIMSTEQIRRELYKEISTKDAHRAALTYLRKRFDPLFTIFLTDTQGKITRDDLRGLCGRIDQLSI